MLLSNSLAFWSWFNF